MCLLVVAWRAHPHFPLVVAANRDERHQRATRPLHRWPEGMIAGRDEEAGGSWLGVFPDGRFASVTNLHPPAPPPPGAPSRGALVRDFLTGGDSAAEFVRRVAGESHHYAGFNLVVGDAEEAYVVCSADSRPIRLTPGVHGIANEPPGTPLAKVARTTTRLSSWLEAGGGDPEPLFEALTDRATGAPRELARETATPRELSPPFVVHPLYGTRCSTVVLMDGDRLEITERSWDAGGAPLGEARETIPLAR